MEDSKVLYEIMICADGVSRAVPFINGNKIDPSIEKVEQEAKEKEEEEIKPKKVISIQDRIINQVETFISAIESQVDDFVDNDFKSNYDCYQHLLDMGCKSIHARKMRQLYLNCFNDLVDVYNGEDEYLNEAWGHLKPQYHKKMMDFYGVIVDDIDRLIKNSTAQRKPRKVKTKSSAKLVNKLKYQVEFNELKLVSINPEKIIGAKELWVYNTKSNKLGVYYAQNSIRGFSVKGCTIQHFDEELSIQKTARKPKDALGSLTKRSLKKKLKEMKTKEQVLTGRINSQTILLGAF